MNKTRLEAFSDGVIAIIITIMVLELHVPQGVGPEALRPLLPSLLSYLLSFIFLGIYWNNHHHLLHAADHVDGRILWANLHLLFWLSLIPLATGWIGQTRFAPLPAALYGSVLLMAAAAYTLLTLAIIAHQGPHSKLREAVGRDWKGKSSILAYLIAIPLAFYMPWISGGLYILVALLWLIPDRRISAKLVDDHHPGHGRGET